MKISEIEVRLSFIDQFKDQASKLIIKRLDLKIFNIVLINLYDYYILNYLNKINSEERRDSF